MMRRQCKEPLLLPDATVLQYPLGWSNTKYYSRFVFIINSIGAMMRRQCKKPLLLPDATVLQLVSQCTTLRSLASDYQVYQSGA